MVEMILEDMAKCRSQGALPQVLQPHRRRPQDEVWSDAASRLSDTQRARRGGLRQAARVSGHGNGMAHQRRHRHPRLRPCLGPGPRTRSRRGTYRRHNPGRIAVTRSSTSAPVPGVTVREFLAAFERVLGRKVPSVDAPPRPGDVAGAYANVDKALRLLDWRPDSLWKTVSATRWSGPDIRNRLSLEPGLGSRLKALFPARPDTSLIAALSLRPI